VSDSNGYMRLVENHIYLSIIRPIISYVVGVVSQFIQNLHTDHWYDVVCILKYIKKTQGQ